MGMKKKSVKRRRAEGDNGEYGYGYCRFGDLQIEDGLTKGIILRVDDLLGLVLVGGLEAGAFAGEFIDAVEHSATGAAED
jgi:hypothetical protein